MDTSKRCDKNIIDNSIKCFLYGFDIGLRNLTFSSYDVELHHLTHYGSAVVVMTRAFRAEVLQSVLDTAH